MSTPDSPSPCCGPSAKGTDLDLRSTDPAIRDAVRQSYAAIASRPQSGCCGAPAPSSTRAFAASVGYSDADLELIPDGANLGLSCGNPTAIAALQPGDVVVDLGSGAGMDAFLAAAKVGAKGRVIGIDMTPEMLALARKNAVAEDVAHFVEFREGFIEDIPVISDSVDVIISNCVINLSHDKPRVFREAFRALKSGGRLAVSDICLSRPLPDQVRAHAAAWAACISGALLADDYIDAIKDAGFTSVTFSRTSADAMFLEPDGCGDDAIKGAVDSLGDEGRDAIRGAIWSYRVEAVKP